MRYSLGNEWLKAGHPDQATVHFREAVTRAPDYSAAWKMLGKALEASGEYEAALDVYRQGITVATDKGDIQAAKEMTVFARRLTRQMPKPE